jgi:membrane dipeptidase
VQLHTVFGAMLKIGDMSGPAYEKVEYVDGLENPTENFTNISRWMVRQGFSDADIEAALGGNIMRALGAIWV